MCSALHFSWRFGIPVLGAVRRQTRIQENPHGNRNGHCPQYFIHGLCYIGVPIVFLRMAMGLVTGFIPTSLAMISAQTPKSSAGKTLGTPQMGQVSGGLFGPLLGGMLADRFGFTYTFLSHPL